MVLMRTTSFDPHRDALSGLAPRLIDVLEKVAEVRSMMSSAEAS